MTHRQYNNGAIARQPAAYIRVSDARQAGADHYSLPAQRDAITAYCTSKGLPAPRWYVEEGRSAHTDDPYKRPLFRQLLEDAQARGFDLLIVIDLDRFARSTLAALMAASALEQCGCAILSLNQPHDFTTPDGRLMFTIHAGVAQYESEQKGRRVKAAIARMRAEGKHYGTVPFGARLVDGRLAVDPDKADVLRRILSEAATVGHHVIADRLTVEGVPPPGSARKRGRWPESEWSRWWPGTVRDIVTNGGWLAAQPAPWPALWLAARSRPRRPTARRDHPTRMLTGLMRCRCGGSLVYSGRRGPQNRQFVQCIARRLRPRGTGCPYRKTYVDVYEAQVVAQLQALPDPANVRQSPPPSAPETAWAELEEDRRRLRNLYLARVLDDQEFAVRLAELRVREASLPRGTPNLGRLREGFPELQRAFPLLPGKEQNAVLRELVIAVRIADHAATVLWRPEVLALCGLPAQEEGAG